MGVAGSGKTTIGRLLAAELGWSIRDADEFHPVANLEKMRKGIPLDDADRAPWLDAMQAAVATWLRDGKSAVLTCSCLKKTYRDHLTPDPHQVRWVYLKGSYKLIVDRISKRSDHFFKKDLLKSQLGILEEPQDAMTIDISQSPHTIVQQIKDCLPL
jgi:gluconokinase